MILTLNGEARKRARPPTSQFQLRQTSVNVHYQQELKNRTAHSKSRIMTKNTELLCYYLMIFNLFQKFIVFLYFSQILLKIYDFYASWKPCILEFDNRGDDYFINVSVDSYNYSR